MQTLKCLWENNYDVLMERFPAIALQLPAMPDEESIPIFSEEALSFPLPDLMQLFYFYGLRDGSVYSYLRPWLQEKPDRKLVILIPDLKELASFLYKEVCTEILADPQCILAQSSDIETLIEKFPLAHVEVETFRSLRKNRFFRLRLKILRKTTLSHGLHLDRLHGHQPFRNFAANLTQLPRSFYANRMEGMFKGIPAIICGAGPSLQKALPLLKTFENKALIMAGGSTLAALSSFGILPHFGMAIDPNPDEYLRLKNSFAFEVPLLYSTRVYPEIFSTCNGPFGYMRAGIGGVPELWMEERLGLKEPLLGTHLNSDTLSVTAICLAWAEFIGCDPIIFSGLDLAYTDRKRYSPGVVFQDRLDQQAHTRAGDRLLWKKGWGGKKVCTAVRWLMEASSFSHFVKKHPKIRFFNTTEGGIGIPGVPYCSLDAVSAQFLTRSQDLRRKVHEAILEASMPSDTAIQIQEGMRLLKESVNRIVDHLAILTGDVLGSFALAEMELYEEMAYPYLFYDMHLILDKELSVARKGEKWRHFFNLAKNYQAVLAL